MKQAAQRVGEASEYRAVEALRDGRGRALRTRRDGGVLHVEMGIGGDSRPPAS